MLKLIESLINYELGKVIEWLNISKLSLNKEKSKYMIFHVPRKETRINSGRQSYMKNT